MASRKQILAELESYEIEGWADPAKIGTPKFKWIPLDKMESSHAECMAARYRSRAAAKAGGAAPCIQHPGEYVGDCLRCTGIWPDQFVLPPAPTTLVEFEKLAGAKSS